MGELGALFNPGMRHEIEERKAKESRREEAGNADPGNKRIDLLSGVAVINMRSKTPKHASQEDTVSDQAAQNDTTAETPAAQTPSAETRAPETPAAETPAPDDDRADESVQSGDAESAESTRNATADHGTAPRANSNVDASEHSDVDPAALEITQQQSSNAEPPA